MREEFEKRFNEEGYLFKVVERRFRDQGWLDAYDLFFIVRWKSDRGVTAIAKSLIRTSGSSLKRASRDLTAEIFDAKTPEARFKIVSSKWKLPLPTASAILTVLFPDEFTVYDRRVCAILRGFHLIEGWTVQNRWLGYLKYKAAVELAAPPGLSLRDKDRYLWALSRHEDLERFLKRTF